MSATVLYQAVKGKALSLGAPSSFIAILERQFGGGPWSFDTTDDAVLQGMEAAVDDKDYRAAFAELREALEKHENIRVWAVY